MPERSLHGRAFLQAFVQVLTLLLVSVGIRSLRLETLDPYVTPIIM